MDLTAENRGGLHANRRYSCSKSKLNTRFYPPSAIRRKQLSSNRRFWQTRLKLRILLRVYVGGRWVSRDDPPDAKTFKGAQGQASFVGAARSAATPSSDHSLTLLAYGPLLARPLNILPITPPFSLTRQIISVTLHSGTVGTERTSRLKVTCARSQLDDQRHHQESRLRRKS
jgi:hypothetical protein